MKILLAEAALRTTIIRLEKEAAVARKLHRAEEYVRILQQINGYKIKLENLLKAKQRVTL